MTSDEIQYLNISDAITNALENKHFIDDSLMTPYLELFISKEIRDFDFTELLYKLYKNEMSNHYQTDNSSIHPINNEITSIRPFILWSLSIDLPEIDSLILSDIVKEDWIVSTFKFLSGSESSLILQRFYIKWIHWNYAFNIKIRPMIRSFLGNSLRTLARSFNSNTDIPAMLRLTLDIINSMQYPFEIKVITDLVRNILLPLHRNNAMVSWRDQIPVLKIYHNELVCILIKVIEIDNATNTNISVPVEQHISSVTILYILKHWPDKFDTNTPKEVLLLHELEALLETLSSFEFEYLSDLIIDRLRIMLKHDNFAPLEKALIIFKNPKVLELFKKKSNQIIESLLPSLYRNGNLHWNATVNKMTANVLKKLSELDPVSFKLCAMRMINNDNENSSCNRVRKGSNKPCSSSSSTPAASCLPPPLPLPLPLPPCLADAPKPNQFTSSFGQIDRSNIPLPTFPKPKSKTSSSNFAKPLPSKSSLIFINNQPPVTITGVAPWAFQKNVPASIPTNTTNSISPVNNEIKLKDNKRICIDSSQDSTREDDHGYSILLSYIEKCTGEEKENNSLNWNEQQSAETPSLLPNLKFHDLVFGKDLGSGAFSTVRYARCITSGSTQSKWPEYAVKIINVQKIEELNYQDSIEREITILNLLSHPGITRMISFFKYTGSVYLVLEYASQGDLHSYLLENGPITSPLHIRFVLGEVISALSSIHEAGFVFNDLKPENICITELGHIKLTDFGACRAYNSYGEKALLQSKNTLHCIRNGDWRDNTDIENRKLEDKLSLKEDSSPDITIAPDFADRRVEGTPAYLPLEVLSKEADFYEIENNMTSLLVDTWSLGCVAYFCCHGRPLFYGDAEQVEFQIRKKFDYFDTSAANNYNSFQKSVSFKFDETAGCMNNDKTTAVLKEETDTASEAELRSLFSHLDDSIRLMLTLDPRQRPHVHQIAKLPFFTHSSTHEETNIYTFHRLPPVKLPRNTVNGTNNAKEWSRRQFSHIWAPMPSAFSMENISKNHSTKVTLLTESCDLAMRTNKILKLVENLVSYSGHYEFIETDLEKSTFFSC